MLNKIKSNENKLIEIVKELRIGASTKFYNELKESTMRVLTEYFGEEGEKLYKQKENEVENLMQDLCISVEREFFQSDLNDALARSVVTSTIVSYTNAMASEIRKAIGI